MSDARSTTSTHHRPQRGRRHCSVCPLAPLVSNENHFSAVVYGHIRHAQGLEFPHLEACRPPPLLPGAAGPPADGRRRTASPSRQAADRRAAGVLGPPPPRRTATRPCLLNGPERVRHTRSTHHCRARVFAVRPSVGWYMSAAARMHEAVYRCGRCYCRQASWATAAI